MPQFDNRKAAQVWQRVHAAPASPTQECGELLALIPPLAECAQSCAGHREAAAAFRRQVSALAGICALTTGQPPRLPGASQGHPGSRPAAALRKCYLTQCRALTQYQALCGHGEYGPAFQALIPLAQENCLRILTLLGGQ